MHLNLRTNQKQRSLSPITAEISDFFFFFSVCSAEPDLGAFGAERRSAGRGPDPPLHDPQGRGDLHTAHGGAGQYPACTCTSAHTSFIAVFFFSSLKPILVNRCGWTVRDLLLCFRLQRPETPGCKFCTQDQRLSLKSVEIDLYLTSCFYVLFYLSSYFP